MAKTKETDLYHKLAKESGNKLKAYVLSVSSGATGVFFIALTNSNAENTYFDKCLLIYALCGFVLTVLFSMFELRLDAQRFFIAAKENEKQKNKQNWEPYNKLKNKRYDLLKATYFTLIVAVFSTSIYLVSKILNS